jgi:hypothetical protein
MVVRSSRARVAALFFGAVLITVALWSVLRGSSLSADSSDYKNFYDPVAAAILEGRGVTLGGIPATSQPPGYALLLGATRGVNRLLGLSDAAALLVLNLISIAASAVLLYEIAALLVGPLASATAYAMWISCPFLLAISKAGLTELPFCALLYAGLFFFFRFVWAGKLRRGQAVATGALLGCAMLVRPIAIGIPVLLVVLLAFAKRTGDLKIRLRFMAGMAAGCLLLVMPWETWVFARTHQWIPLSTNGVRSMRDGLTYAVNPKQYRARIPVSPGVKEVQLAVLQKGTDLGSMGDIAALLWEQWRERPWAVTGLLATKAARSWYATDSGRFDRYILLIQAVYLLAGIVGGLLAVRDRRMRVSLAPVAALIGYFWAMTTAFLSILRYMVPAMGLVFLVTAAGVDLAVKARGAARQEASAVDVGITG